MIPLIMGTSATSSSGPLRPTMQLSVKRDQTVSGVDWSETLGLFCAVTVTSYSPSTTTSIITSPDGLNWTVRHTSSRILKLVKWSPGLGKFCAVGAAGSLDPFTYAVSSDGITWTEGTVNSFNVQPPRSFVWASGIGKFCVSASERILSSADGTNWTSVTGPGSDGFQAMGYSAELNLLVGTRNNSIFTSPDATTWTLRNTTALGSANSVSSGNGRILALGSITASAYSANGLDWSRLPDLFETAGPSCFLPERQRFFIAPAGFSGNTVNNVISVNGDAWYQRPSIIPDVPYSTLADVCWSPSLQKLCVVGGKNEIPGEGHIFLADWP